MSRPLVIRPRASSIAVLNSRPKQTLEAGTADQFLLVRRAIRRHILSDVDTKTDIPDKALLRRSDIPHNHLESWLSAVGLVFKKRSPHRGFDRSADREQPCDQHERLCQLEAQAQPNLNGTPASRSYRVLPMLAAFEEIGNKARLVRAIQLEAVLQRTGCSRDSLDRAKWHTPEGVISVTGQKFMNWTEGTGGGGAIDLVMHLRRCEFKTAVFWLSNGFPSAGVQTLQRAASISQPALALPKRDESRVQQVRDYLGTCRCIPVGLIDLLIRCGKLYADNRANAVFLLLGKEKAVVGAELRGTTHSRWHGLAPGSRKDLGCFYLTSTNTRKAVLCESAIDAISYFALHPNCLALSTSGATASPVWLSILIEKGFDLYCGFDSDEPGDSLADRMICRYPSVKRLRPPEKDWNEALQSRTPLH